MRRALWRAGDADAGECIDHGKHSKLERLAPRLTSEEGWTDEAVTEALAEAIAVNEQAISDYLEALRAELASHDRPIRSVTFNGPPDRLIVH